MQTQDRIFVAGHRGTVGSAITRKLQREGFENLILKSRGELDLSSRKAVCGFFEKARPDVVILAAAKVGGIAANMANPVEFLTINLAIQNNVLLACRDFNVSKTVFLGSSCIYPREAKQPMREDALMTGKLEPTNESYAIAKIAGIRLAQALHEQDGLRVICPNPSNVYGPGDHFDFERAHVVSALIRRFLDAVHQRADSITLWGSGTAQREFLHVDDLADAILFLMDRIETPEIVNVGTGEEVTIKALAELVAQSVGFRGSTVWDTSQPDGMPRKLLDVSKIRALGWKHQISLTEGIQSVIDDYRNRFPSGIIEGSRTR